MAENKKSFIAYTDWKETFEALPDDKAGQLAKHIWRYVSDENPKTDDILINAVFANIKQTLKRDLVKYENIIERNTINGQKGGRPKKQQEPKKPTGLIGNPKEPTGLIGNPKEPKKPDSVNDSVNDSEREEIKNISKKVYFEKFPLLDSAFKDYLKVRKQSKYTMTERAIEALVKKLREISGGDPNIAINVIDNAILGKWKSFYPNKD